MDELILRFRRFNRFYTNHLGYLNPKLLDSPLTMAEGRVLFEIVNEPGITAAKAGRILNMDRAQASRILKKLERLKLVEREGEPAGRRAVPVKPTQKGLDVLAGIDRAAKRQAGDFLSRLDLGGRELLLSSMQAIENILDNRPEPDRKPVVREAESGDMGWVVQRHARLYKKEFGFDEEFERYVLLGLAEYARQEGKTRSRLWVAEINGSVQGSIAIVETNRDTAQLRWFLVEPQSRRLGVGRALLDHALGYAKTAGIKTIFLWTLDHLQSARGLYQEFGFKLEERKQGRMGGQDVFEEKWRLEY